MRAVIADMPKHWLEERKNSEAAQWDEVWNGVYHMAPMPSGSHQDLELDLGSFLKRAWALPIGGLVRHQVNLTTPDDESDWRRNYRIPDLVILTPERRNIDRDEYMAGAPAAVVEIESPGDETYDKFDFYSELGVPEVWVIHRDTKVPTIFTLAGGQYQPVPADADGWVRSGLGIELRPAQPGRLGVRLGANPAAAAELPEG